LYHSVIETDFQSLIFKYDIILSSEMHPADRGAKREAFKVLALSLLGLLRPAYYLCGLDIGKGKSTLIQTFLRLWKENDFKPAGSALICLSRLDEIERFTFESKLDKDDYAVVSRDGRLNSFGLGTAAAGFARVLFTTQQMVEAQAKQVDRFEDIEAFHYLGQPRPTRIWDEKLQEFKDVTIPMDTLTALPLTLRREHDLTMAMLERFTASAMILTSGDTITVPESLADRLKLVFPWKALETLPITKAQKDAILALADMGGSVLTASVGVKRQLGLLGARRALPVDFLPAMVFDASARLSIPYALRERHAGNVVRLKSSTHDYSPLTIRHWNLAMGDDKRADPAHRIVYLKAVADLINSFPGEDVLVLHHKVEEGLVGVKHELEPMLTDKKQVHYLHWGIHQGTNAYRHIKKIIVLGLWIKPGWVYDALHMASSGLSAHGLDPDDANALRWGEYMRDLLQGVGRINVRNGFGGKSGQAEAHLIAKGGDRFDEAIRQAFPGCRYEEWQPVPVTCKGQMQAVQVFLIAAFSDPSVKSVSKRDVRDAVGISKSQGLSQILRDKRTNVFLAANALDSSRRVIKRIEPKV
jgi:hypothetical protein